jgi:hypothetical protein
VRELTKTTKQKQQNRKGKRENGRKAGIIVDAGSHTCKHSSPKRAKKDRHNR